MKEREEEKGITPEQAMEMLKKENYSVTQEQAKIILDFLVKLANIAVGNYLRNEAMKRQYPIR